MVCPRPFKSLTTNIHFRFVFDSIHSLTIFFFCQSNARTLDCPHARTIFYFVWVKIQMNVTFGNRTNRRRVRKVSSRLLSVKAKRIAAVQCRLGSSPHTMRVQLRFFFYNLHVAFHFGLSSSCLVQPQSYRSHQNSQMGQNRIHRIIVPLMIVAHI